MNSQPIEVTSIDGVLPYLQSIDWSEHWLQGVIGFHGLTASITVLSRKCFNVQIALFFIYLGIIYCAEYINNFAAEHYKVYSAQQYFDSGGLFISIILSTPLLLNCLFIIVVWMWSSFDLMVNLKRAQIRQTISEAKQEVSAAKQEVSASENKKDK